MEEYNNSSGRTKSPIPHNLDGYTFEREIGQGSFSIVYLGIRTSSGNPVAIKAIPLGRLNRKLLDNLHSEINALRNVSSCSNIVKLIDIVKKEKCVYLVMEYCAGGDIGELLKKRGGKLNVQLVQILMTQLASALKALYKANLVHRDLKPQNLLLSHPLSSDNSSEEVTLKVADFGFARFMQPSDLAETLCGSPLYMAPEILRYEKYDSKADLWSVGAIMYEMIYGQPPYRGQNHIHLVKIIERAGPLQLPIEPVISESTRHLLLSLLQKNPTERISFSDFFKHSYFKEKKEENAISMLLATSAPRNIVGPSALTQALSRKNSLSSSPVVRSSSSSSLLCSSVMIGGNRFTRVSLEEELIDLVPADYRRQLRYALVLADIALERLTDPSAPLIQLTALEHLVEAEDLLTIFPNEHAQQLFHILQKKIQSLDHLLARLHTTEIKSMLEAVDLDELFFEYARELGIEAGIKDMLQYNAWRMYQRAIAVANESSYGEPVAAILQERI